MNGDRPPRLEPTQLFEKRAARDKSKLKAYNQILNQIHTRIYHTSQLTGNSNALVYTIPPFILGLPSIDLEDCVVYIVHMLRQSGFVVKFTYPNLLYISWKHYEAEYNKKQNPIVQAMTPQNAQNTSKKGAGGNRGNAQQGSGQGPPAYNQDFGLSTSGNHAPPRSATDYKPPDVFLNNLQRSPQPASIGNGVPNKPAQHDILADLWKFT